MMDKDKIVFKGSHPDSLYRVPNDSTITSNKFTRIIRLLRWPATLVLVCIALAVFVYFLMPGNIDVEVEPVNGTYWESIEADAQSHRQSNKLEHKPSEPNTKKENHSSHHYGTKPTEIDFYDADNKNYDIPSVLDVITETTPNRKLPVQPFYPSHITPEVQYGNEKADVDKLRTPKLLGDIDKLPEDSTLKPHITQKPEKPLEIHFNNGNSETTSSTETISDFVNIEEKPATNNKIELISKAQPSIHKAYTIPAHVTNKATQYNSKDAYNPYVELPPELQEYYPRRPVNINFTSGHSKLFGISIEDAEKMQSTTQSSLYNTKVSPTLPTWRDGDDTTTKKYPTNINSEVPQCRSTRLALCRGVLPYDLAGSSATIKGVEITTLLSQIEYLVATNCSDRVRHFACALLEPECNPPPYPPKIPCYSLCKAVLDNCEGLIPRELTPAFKCNQYSNTNCVAAKSPCYPRERACGDGMCIPRDWICDGNEDCPGGEDEASCLQCDKHEYRCRSGGCIRKQWICDGYADCPDGEDEDDAGCAPRGRSLTGVQIAEPGEESAGSAPAPVVRRPNRLPMQSRQGQPRGESDNSKELLMTSDSGNPYKRNFTRRPSPSRLVPYTRKVPDPPADSKELPAAQEMRKLATSSENTTPLNQDDSKEDVNVEDMGFFDDLKKTTKEMSTKHIQVRPQNVLKPNADKAIGMQSTTRLDKSINKLEKVIDGAAMLKEAVAEKTPDTKDEEYDSPETNVTASKRTPAGSQDISISAHVSPCPSGELRCVDGRCITLAQLCDGTIDCSDHADEDNCFT